LMVRYSGKKVVGIKNGTLQGGCQRHHYTSKFGGNRY
jgi:hypothetical protein